MTEHPPVRLRLLSRRDCRLCEELREHVDALLGERAREWEILDVDSDSELARRYGESIPVLFVNGRLFAKVRLPRSGARRALLRAAERP